MIAAPPPIGRAEAEAWVARHLAPVVDGPITGSGRFVGGQTAADRALAGFDVTGYAADRNQVLPQDRRGASGLSPWIRHGMLTLSRVWDHVAGGPGRDVRKFRDELMWQEYARHRYARLGRAPWGRPPPPDDTAQSDAAEEGMACLDAARRELTTDGWIVNQTRMWLASHWTVRHGLAWEHGERAMYRELLDGSSAANGLGWQWTAGVVTGKAYGFSRYQVERRAPGLCAKCPLRDQCPIEQWPDASPVTRLQLGPRMRTDVDVDATAGPRSARLSGPDPDAVWITAESMGDDDPALAAHVAAPVVFVFDMALLARLRLASRRLVFLVESLADLAQRRSVDVLFGDPVDVLAGRRLAATFTPVPGWKHRAQQLDVAALHPWPWLVWPHSGPVATFSSWRRALER